MTDSVAELANLADAPTGTPLRVQRVDADGGDAARLQAMGVCVGRVIQVVKSGNPLIVRVAGTRIGVSARLAADVFVEG